VCGRKDPTIVTEEIPLCGGRDRGFAKYRFFLTIQDRSHGKTTNP